MQPQDGNTIAINLANSHTVSDEIHQYVRVTFFNHDNNDNTDIYTEAVLCTDLYAEQIAKEKDSNSSNKFFSDMFA